MKLVFAAGGTAGHINPALAVASYIREHQKGAEILFVGTADKLEAKLVPQAGFRFETINISGFQRKISFQNIKRNAVTLSNLLRASGQAKRILRDFKPDVVVGFGGYVSGPVLRKAAQMGIRTVTHEQNAFPGVTTKMLAKMVDRVMLTVQDAESHLRPKHPCLVTGLPVRAELLQANRELARFELGLDERPLILSFGGSLGAKRINEAMTEFMALTHHGAPYYHIHAMGQYGLWMPDLLREKGVDLQNEPQIMIREYIEDMARCLAAADLVICRAGASTLSEIEAVGRPAILIPSPNVAENHQYHNAMALVRRDAAMILEEKDLGGEKLKAMVEALFAAPGHLAEMAENAAQMGVPDANALICKVITELAVPV